MQLTFMLILYLATLASLLAQMVKNLPAMQETQVQSLAQEEPWKSEWQPIPLFLSGEFHGHN